MYSTHSYYGFLSSSLDGLIKELQNDDLLNKNEEFLNQWNLSQNKLVCPDEFFKRKGDHKLPVINLNKEDFFSTI